VTDGHEVYSRPERQECVLRILSEVEAGNGFSQRSLARGARIALGLTNIVLRDLVGRGWVRVSEHNHGVRYVITPEGLTEKHRISTARLARTTRYYVEARDRVRDRLVALSRAAWTTPDGGPAKRLALYGATDVAEIAYICLQDTDLKVTAVFDGDGSKHFFGTRVIPMSRLGDPSAWGEFDVLMVLSFEDSDRARAGEHLRNVKFPPERVFWL
jgi:predicted transcriptional regulator